MMSERIRVSILRLPARAFAMALALTVQPSLADTAGTRLAATGVGPPPAQGAAAQGAAVERAFTPPQPKQSPLKPIVDAASRIVIDLPIEAAVSMAWRPDGKELAIGTYRDDIVYVVSPQQRKVVRKVEVSSPGGPNRVAYSPDGRVLAGGSADIELWDAHSGEKLRNIRGPFVPEKQPHPVELTGLAFSPDSRLLAAVYVREKAALGIAVYRASDGELVWSIEPEQGTTPAGILFSRDGKFLITSQSIGRRFPRNADGFETDIDKYSVIDVYEVESGKLFRSIDRAHTLRLEAMALSRDGTVLATSSNTGDSDGRQIGRGVFKNIQNKDPIRLWDWGARRLIGELSAFPYGPSGMGFSGDGRFLASCQITELRSPLGYIWIWDVENRALLQKLDTTPDAVQGNTGFCMFSPDDKYVSAVGRNHLILYPVRAD